MSEQPLDFEIVKSVFNRAWPELRDAMEEARNAIPPDDETAFPKLDAAALSSEVLASLQRIENGIAKLTPRPSLLALASALRDWHAGQIPLRDHDKLHKYYEDALIALARGENADGPLKGLIASAMKGEASTGEASAPASYTVVGKEDPIKAKKGQ